MDKILSTLNQLSAASPSYLAVTINQNSTTTLSTPRALWQAMSALQPQSGWLQMTAQNRCFFSQSEFDQLFDAAQKQPLLAGELVLVDGASAQVQFLGGSLWQLSILACQTASDSEATDWLAQDITLVGHHGVASLKYRRYFQLDDEQGPQLMNGRLMAIEAQTHE